MKYTNRSVQLGEAGLVQSVSEGAHNFLYRVSTVKDPKWNIGDVVEIGGGRKCVYSKSTGATALYNQRGCSFSGTGYIGWTTFTTSAAIGATELTIPATSHAVLAKDELAGGFIAIFDGDVDLYSTTRMIVGNDEAADGATFKVYLDAKLTYAVTSGTSVLEIYENPYGAMIGGATDRDTVKAGVPMAYVSAAANYFWVQVEGIVWVTPQGNLGNTGGYNSGWWHDWGNITDINTALGLTPAASTSSQYAGYPIAGSIGGNGPLFCLKG